MKLEIAGKFGSITIEVEGSVSEPMIEQAISSLRAKFDIPDPMMAMVPMLEKLVPRRRRAAS